MATAKAVLHHIPGAQMGFCEWETVGGPCHNSQPAAILREIIYYDGKPTLVCPNHYRKWELENKLYMKHIRVW